jgi:hypothetical protein
VSGKVASGSAAHEPVTVRGRSSCRYGHKPNPTMKHTATQPWVFGGAGDTTQLQTSSRVGTSRVKLKQTAVMSTGSLPPDGDWQK